jgi:predicted TIM-barrel fold metal-dependent hydrolase
MLAALILHNLFGRFPGIEVLTVELGSAWVDPLLKSLDKAARTGHQNSWLGGSLSDLPSEVFRHHVYVTPYYEDDIPGLVELVGADRVLFGSDYPHPEGLADPASFAEEIVSLSDDQVRRVMRDNAAALLGLVH